MFVEVNILLFCYGTSIAYLVTLGDILTPLGQLVFGLDHFMSHRVVLMTIFCVFVMLPLSLLRDISSLQFSSLLGIFAILFLVLAVVLRSMMIISSPGEGLARDIHWGINFDQGLDMLLSLPIISFAFTNQVNVFSIYTELQRPNIRRMSKVRPCLSLGMKNVS